MTMVSTGGTRTTHKSPCHVVLVPVRWEVSSKQELILIRFVKTSNQKTPDSENCRTGTKFLIISAMGTWTLNSIYFLALVGHIVKSEVIQTTYRYYEHPTGNHDLLSPLQRLLRNLWKLRGYDMECSL